MFYNAKQRQLSTTIAVMKPLCAAHLVSDRINPSGPYSQTLRAHSILTYGHQSAESVSQIGRSFCFPKHSKSSHSYTETTERNPLYAPSKVPLTCHATPLKRTSPIFPSSHLVIPFTRILVVKPMWQSGLYTGNGLEGNIAGRLGCSERRHSHLL